MAPEMDKQRDICMHCKKVREDSGSWRHREDNAQESPGKEYNESICPECSLKLYPKFYSRE